ncbi:MULTISPECIES: thioesterase family protein [Nocardiaceae]|nr:MULTISPECIES: thioesterase family protein [Rhodococcus]
MGELIIETTLVRRGRRFCLLDSELRTADGKTLVRSHGPEATARTRESY